MREAQCEYKGIPLEASYHLNDEMSKLLGYFDFNNLKPFEPAYLSGFYADRYDIDKQKAEETAVKRIIEDFNRKIRYSVPAKDLRILEHTRYLSPPDHCLHILLPYPCPDPLH